MLQKLTIRNYALIESLEIDFSDNMTVITGETGAGKSILLGALGLILGNRADTKTLLNDTEKCVVEGIFTIDNLDIKWFFDANDLDYDDIVFVRREILPSAKSRAFINDTPVSIQLLKELGERLIDLNSQHHTLQLNETNFQLTIVDALAKNQLVIEKYDEALQNFRTLDKAYHQLRTNEQLLKSETDFVQFMYEELQKLNISNPNEQELLEQEQSLLENSETIKTRLQQTITLLSFNDQSAVNQLGLAQNSLSHIQKFNAKIEGLHNRLRAIYVELKELCFEIENLNEELSSNPERLMVVGNRLSEIYRLQQKHRLSSLVELLNLSENLEKKLHSISNFDGNLEQKLKAVQVAEKATRTIALQLSERRKKVIAPFETQVSAMLRELNMPHAKIKLQQITVEELQKRNFGIDRIELLFSANKGGEPIEIAKAASGGELSRVMLCIKSLVADYMQMPTIIFDEIDTGVSGEVAFKVGEMMQKLAHKHQVVAITHLPQIASKGDKHFFVYKDNSSQNTVSKIKLLTTEERVVEIAKMISGERVTETALQTARELMGINV